MKISEAMTGNPITININASLDAAADLMSRNDVGALPVEENGKLRGMLTDRDIVVRAVAQRRDPISTRVGDVFTPEVYACYEDQELNEVAQLMEEKQIHRVIVLDHQDKPVGIMSISDILLHGAKDTACEVLEKVSVPVHSIAREKQFKHGHSF